MSAADLSAATVLELGAGLGLPGLAAAIAFNSPRVVLTDTAPLLDGLRRNVEANGVGERVEVRELGWGSDEVEEFGREFGEVDVVLMSDLFFDPEEMGGLGR
ncbi:methyltransferase-like protein 23, partial [Phalaenopsis equestris]|uniref:methyltransferase-like protein 23 n=1 Tax=Phalaenopsis equestris TaxID=78828 RepID=UPI0009E5F408